METNPLDPIGLREVRERLEERRGREGRRNLWLFLGLGLGVSAFLLSVGFGLMGWLLAVPTSGGY